MAFLKIDYDKRIFGLDVMRALAIIIVLLSHSSSLLEDTLLNGFPYVSLLDGVELFFVLSGFLIGTILLKETQNGVFSFTSLINFWKRRWFRTLPNYYLILVVNILLVVFEILPGKKEAISWKFFFFLQNFNAPFVDFFWESWSLSVEEWFYVFFGVLLFILIRFLNVMHAYLVIALLFIIIPLVFRIHLSNRIVDYFWWDVTFRKVVLCRLDAIGYGVLAAWISFYFEQLWRKIRYYALVIGLVGFVALPYFSINEEIFYYKTFYFSVTSFICALWLPYLSSLNVKSNPVTRFINYVSVVSYSLYLLNLSIVEQTIKIYSPFTGITNYTLFWILNFVLATLLYKYFEKPVLDLRERKL